MWTPSKDSQITTDRMPNGRPIIAIFFVICWNRPWAPESGFLVCALGCLDAWIPGGQGDLCGKQRTHKTATWRLWPTNHGRCATCVAHSIEQPIEAARFSFTWWIFVTRHSANGQLSTILGRIALTAWEAIESMANFQKRIGNDGHSGGRLPSMTFLNT